MKPATAIGGGSRVPLARKSINRPIVIGLIVLLVAVAARLILSHHESKFERIATSVTEALQKNDVAAVKQYQNAETATLVTASVVGRGSDALAPLGTLKTVKQISGDADTRVHRFDVTFAHGTLQETIKFDPDDKVVSFRYDDIILTK